MRTSTTIGTSRRPGLAAGSLDSRSGWPTTRPGRSSTGPGPGWRTLGAGRLHPGQLRPRDLDLEGGRRPLHGPAGRRPPVEEGVRQLRDGRPLAAPEVGRELGLLRLDPGRGARGAQAGRPARGRDRGPGARPRLYRAVREASSGKKADWFTTHGDVFPVGTSRMKPFAADLAQRLAELPLEAAEQGPQRVEPLLRPGDQRRGPALGQRRGGLRRDRLRPARGLPLPGVRRARPSSSSQIRIRELP